MFDDEAALNEREKRLLSLFRDLSPRARVMLIEYAEKITSDEKALRGENTDNSICGQNRV